MTVAFTGAGGLFTRIGQIGRTLYLLHGGDHGAAGQLQLAIAQAGNQGSIKMDVNAVDVLAGVSAAVTLSGTNAAKGAIKKAAESVLTKMVSEDATLPSSTDVNAALVELVAQMNTAGASVTRNTVTVASSAGGSNNGTGTVLTSVIDPATGLTRRNVYNETGSLICTADSQTGGVGVGGESFSYLGDPKASDEFGPDWPAGSAASARLTSVDSLLEQKFTSNMLRNGSFETYNSTDKTWAGWTIVAGTVGTHLDSSTTQFYRGVKSLKFTGDGSTLNSLTQSFGASDGTSVSLAPLTAYGVCIRARTDAAPAAGVAKVQLIDGTGAVVNDAAGTANTVTITLTGLTTSWSTTTAVFRTPRVLPTGLKLRLILTTAIENTKTAYFDDICVVPMTSLYAGGPLAAVFSGATKWIKGDVYSVTVGNNYGGADYGATFQTLFDRLFDMKGKGLMLPDAASPTIADTLITAVYP